MSCEPGCLTCQQLRAIAAAIVGEHGGDALSLQALSAQAGCSPDAVREHYASAEVCLYAAYDELSFELFVDSAGAFERATSWESGFVYAFERLLARLGERPAHARLCFVEAPADRALRFRRAATRRWAIELLVRGRERYGETVELSELQIELLVGAGSQAIAAAVADGSRGALLALGPRLRELVSVFVPVGV